MFPWFTQPARHLGKADTYTMPVPHLSHMGNFWAFPIDAATLVTGALTLLNPEGLLGSPKMRKTKVGQEVQDCNLRVT